MGSTTTIDDDLHPVQDLEIHPLAEIFPPLDGDAFASLAESIKRDGLLQPVIVMDGHIIDGRNRYRACRLVGRPLYRGEVQEFHGTEAEALAYVTATNLERRHLTQSQRALIAADIARLGRGRQRAGEMSLTTDEAAQRFAVSNTLIDIARKVKRQVEPHVLHMVREGKIKLAHARAIAKLKPDEQRALDSAELVIAAASGSALLPRGMARRTPESLVALMIDAAGELAVRGDVGALAAGIQRKDAESVIERLDGALKAMLELRNAVHARVATT